MPVHQWPNYGVVLGRQLYFYAKDVASIDTIISSLKDEFLIKREEDVVGFFGLNIIRDKDKGAVTLPQSGLIDKILESTNMEYFNLKFTPAENIPLHKDLDRDPCCEYWYYRSIVGMLLYLAGSTCPNIAYAVHQCARFSHQPKTSHEIRLKHIVRYPKGTRDKNLIMKPDPKNLKIDFFTDADFAGLYESKDKNIPH